MVSGSGADGRVVLIALFRSAIVKSLLYQEVRFKSKGIFWVLWSFVIWADWLGGPVISLASAFATSTGFVRSLFPISRTMAVCGGAALSLRILFQIMVVVVV
jgi:hypothetical protein